MKKLILIALLLTGCVFNTYTVEEREQQQERRIRWAIEKQLDYERLVRDCQLYNSCRGAYKIYNSDPDKRN